LGPTRRISDSWSAFSASASATVDSSFGFKNPLRCLSVRLVVSSVVQWGLPAAAPSPTLGPVRSPRHNQGSDLHIYTSPIPTNIPFAISIWTVKWGRISDKDVFIISLTSALLVLSNLPGTSRHFRALEKGFKSREIRRHSQWDRANGTGNSLGLLFERNVAATTPRFRLNQAGVFSKRIHNFGPR
jgi:hypothetical protein